MLLAFLFLDGNPAGYVIVFSLFIGMLLLEQLRLNEEEGIKVIMSCRSTSIKIEFILWLLSLLRFNTLNPRLILEEDFILNAFSNYLLN